MGEKTVYAHGIGKLFDPSVIRLICCIANRLLIFLQMFRVWFYFRIHGEKVIIQDLTRRIQMKLSTRNQIKGKITDIATGQVMARVKVDIGGGNIVSSTITVDAVKDLGLKVGDNVTVLIKASSVMIGK